MRLRNHVRAQLLAFVAVSALGVAYVGFDYVGLGADLVGGSYRVSADFPDSGGIFTNAEVTYRGVQVGRVGALHLLPDGVRVDLRIDRDAPRIPAGASAVVTDRSAVGEQYVDLRPTHGGGPYLRAGQVIPMGRNRVPVATQTLLLNLDRLVDSVDRGSLTTVIDQLGSAFAGTGPRLADLLDQGGNLLGSARDALPETLTLIRDARTVLGTQVRSGSAIRGFAHDLALLTGQLRASDPDLRSLLANGPPAATQLRTLLSGNRTDVGVLLANLDTLSQLTVRRTAGIEQVLVTYPNVVAGGFTVAPGDGTAHFGLVLNVGDPPPCTAGYGGTTRRVPQDTTDTPANTDAHCATPPGSGTDVRGAQNAPHAGTPAQVRPPGGVGSASQAGPPAGLPLPGSAGGDRDLLGDRSWLALLLNGLSG
ncbi:MAG TPA: MCE family protein [Mycobacteriales bacterium]|nr:MCE family protein [Mycobacteriales bacterium]